MKLEPQVAVLVNKICAEWNRAERAIKISEQVIGEDPFPSIKELRYAGRRIVEAFASLDYGDDSDALAQLQDAYFDCLRAKHDAMDVAINEIAGRIRLSQEDLGPETVIQAFPEFTQLLRGLNVFESQIADSREARGTRDAVYEEIQTNFDDTLRLYDEFKASEALMKHLADNAALAARLLEKKEADLERKSSRERVISVTIAVIGVVATIIIGILAL